MDHSDLRLDSTRNRGVAWDIGGKQQAAGWLPLLEIPGGAGKQFGVRSLARAAARPSAKAAERGFHGANERLPFYIAQKRSSVRLCAGGDAEPPSRGGERFTRRKSLSAGTLQHQILELPVDVMAFGQLG
jgi:hypothetical protein